MLHKQLGSLLVAVFLALTWTGTGLAQQSSPADGESHFSAGERDEIGRLVRQYLLENPEVLEEAIRVLRERRDREQAEAAQRALESNRNALLNDENSPVGGNADGDVTIVEFFDYQCGYCKRAYPQMMSAVANDGNVRIVFKEFPILGPVSLFASQAALASRNQNKYEAFHNALMEFRGELTREAVMQIAGSVGLDTAQLQEDMRDPAIRGIIERNYELARSLGIDGTPAFIIGDELIPGAIDAERFRRHIAEARENCDSNVC